MSSLQTLARNSTSRSAWRRPSTSTRRESGRRRLRRQISGPSVRETFLFKPARSPEISAGQCHSSPPASKVFKRNSAWGTVTGSKQRWESDAMAQITIGGRSIGDASPTYFVADISANHDGSLERARLLIRLAAVAGADAAKFQNFRAPAIVSRRGFADLGGQFSHQSRWKKSVYEVYEEAALPWEWTAALRAECDSAGIDYFSTPYDFEAVDMLDPYVKMFKIGSGDITWLEMLRHVAGKGKPVLLATGAANIGDVQRAVHAIGEINPHIVLMHFYFNYTATTENFAHIHLNVLKTYHA